MGKLNFANYGTFKWMLLFYSSFKAAIYQLELVQKLIRVKYWKHNATTGQSEWRIKNLSLRSYLILLGFIWQPCPVPQLNSELRFLPCLCKSPFIPLCVNRSDCGAWANLVYAPSTALHNYHCLSMETLIEGRLLLFILEITGEGNVTKGGVYRHHDCDRLNVLWQMTEVTEWFNHLSW